MAGISFVEQTCFVHSNDPVQDPQLVLTGAPDSESPTNLDLEIGSELRFVPIQVLIGAEAGEVVTMDNTCEMTVRVPESARRGSTTPKAYVLKHVPVHVFPNSPSVTCSIHAFDLAGNQVGR